MSVEDHLAAVWAELQPIGREHSGGYRRFAWSEADFECRAWFVRTATASGLDVETDHNGNLWAWWDVDGSGREGAVVTGSHLDSVPDGGAYDGPLGVAGGLVALAELRRRGRRPLRPLAVVAFSDEEGARFGLACVGSRLLTGTLDPAQARALTDARGTTLEAAMGAAGIDTAALGRDDGALQRIGTFVELHIEQGRFLTHCDAAVGVAAAIWPHGRWRLSFHGRADHAGTTALEDRSDPMLPFARTVLAARAAAAAEGSLATVGRVLVEPNGTNAVPAVVHAWLDARAVDEDTLARTVAAVEEAARAAAASDGVVVESRSESATAAVTFPHALRDRIAAAAKAASGSGRALPALPTGAGHDAGILAAHVPSAMLFVRNPTGVSHSPAEHCSVEDRVAGVEALVAALAELACA